MYEAKKKEAAKEGERVDVVVEDIGASDYHNTEKFVDLLIKNKSFVMNSIIEFIAGRHDKNMTGRIPRYAKDLLEFDVFKDFIKKNLEFNKIISKINITNRLQSADLLVSDKVLNYLKKKPDKFKELFIDMNKKHPIRYTNQSENY